MTNEVATVDESSLDMLPAARPMHSGAMAVLRQNAEAMDIAYHFAKGVCGGELGGRFRGKPGDGAAAILIATG